MTLGIVLSSDTIPSCAASSVSSARPSPSPHPQQPPIISEQAPARDTSSLQSQKMTVGSKQKRVRDLSLERQHVKKSKTQNRAEGVAESSKGQRSPSSPTFLNISRAAAEAPQCRARLRANFKNITVSPACKLTLFLYCAFLTASLPSHLLNRCHHKRLSQILRCC